VVTPPPSTGPTSPRPPAAAPARAEAAQKGEVGHARLDTGIPALDRIWGGLWPGELYYLMARSRHRQTPCMMQIARNHGFRIELQKQRPGACGRAADTALAL
jgi:replicative DNA helicase